MKSNELLRKAVQVALASGVAAAFAAPSVFAQDQDQEGDDDEARELDRVQVTGSRIKRTDMEGALPVTTIDREQIELSGESNAADLIRNLPFNSTGSYRPQSGSSFGGASLVSLRGLGPSRTLVLINGRRQPKSPLTGSSNDLSTIPMGAIERIEILSDGASAIYGSDAIGGVINVILRDDFEGAEVMVGTADVSIPDEGGDRNEGHAVFGTSGPNGQMIAGVSWNSREIIFARDFPWTTGGASVYSNNYTTGTVSPAPTNQQVSENPDLYFADNFNYTALPGACAALPGPWLEFQNQGRTQCGYDFTRVSADEASLSNESAFVRAEHYINDDWTAFMDVSVNKTHSFGRYAPVPDSSYFAAPVSPTSDNNPTNPNGYFGNQGMTPQYVNVWHRFDALGNRDNDINNELADLLLGASGYVGTAEVEFGLRETQNKVYDIGRNYLVRPIAYNYIETGQYDISDPYSNDDDTLNAMKATISRISRYDQKEAFGSVAFDAGALPAGPLSWSVGAEYREEDYKDQYDSLSEAGQIGGSAGNTAGLARDVSAVYFEGLAPLADWAEMSIAGRYEDYSDYGSDFAPKVGFRFDVMDDLVLRASYGQGFRAPTLDILSQETTFSAAFVTDPQTCQVLQGDPSCPLGDPQVNSFSIANPELSSEQSDQFSVGLAWAPTDWLNGTLDIYNIQIEDRINFFSAQEIINRDIAGEPIPSGLGVTRVQTGSAAGAISRVDTGYGNEGTVDTQGLDLNIQTNYDALGGRIRHELQGSYVLNYEVDGERNQTGDPGFPRARAGLNNTYAIGDISFAWNINYIGEQCDSLASVGYQNEPECQGKVPSWVTNDVQFNYFTPWDSRITIGAQNVGEKFPPIGKGFTDGRDYDFNLYNGYGRVVYARFTQNF